MVTAGVGVATLKVILLIFLLKKCAVLNNSQGTMRHDHLCVLQIPVNISPNSRNCICI